MIDNSPLARHIFNCLAVTDMVLMDKIQLTNPIILEK